MRKPSRILVVDDESGMIRAVERVLGTTHRVVGIQSSVQAVALAAEFQPDLVILDVRMPEIDGFELMARLKSTHPAPDIILMTGSIDDMDQKLIRALRGRAFYFIQKPFVPAKLVDKVNEILDLKVRPGLAGDGGGLEIIGLHDKKLMIRYQGACGSCPSSLAGTLYAIEHMLKQEVDPELEVVSV